MDEQQTAARVRAQVRALGTRGRGQRYPIALRRQILAYVAARRAQGATLRAASREVDMSWRTVEHWLHDGKDEKAVLRPVTLTPSVAPERVASVVVHGPRGLRIEGLDVRQLAELLARLG
jgi:hypothetical protein